MSSTIPQGEVLDWVKRRKWNGHQNSSLTAPWLGIQWDLPQSPVTMTFLPRQTIPLNCDPKETIPSLNCFGLVFCDSHEKINKTTGFICQDLEHHLTSQTSISLWNKRWYFPPNSSTRVLRVRPCNRRKNIINGEVFVYVYICWSVGGERDM